MVLGNDVYWSRSLRLSSSRFRNAIIKDFTRKLPLLKVLFLKVPFLQVNIAHPRIYGLTDLTYLFNLFEPPEVSV